MRYKIDVMCGLGAIYDKFHLILESLLKYRIHSNQVSHKNIVKTLSYILKVKEDILSKLINLIYFLDYTSIYKAIIQQIDPSPVESIDFVKKRL